MYTICPRCKVKVLPFRNWFKHECDVNGFYYFFKSDAEIEALRKWAKRNAQKFLYGE